MKICGGGGKRGYTAEEPVTANVCVCIPDAGPLAHAAFVDVVTCSADK